MALTLAKQEMTVVTSLFSTTHFLKRSGTGYFGRRFGSFLVVLQTKHCLVDTKHTV